MDQQTLEELAELQSHIEEATHQIEVTERTIEGLNKNPHKELKIERMGYHIKIPDELKNPLVQILKNHWEQRLKTLQAKAENL